MKFILYFWKLLKSKSRVYLLPPGMKEGFTLPQMREMCIDDHAASSALLWQGELRNLQLSPASKHPTPTRKSF